ncbi:MAG: outer membrane lipoprotein-sorting protein, partial [Pseudomonadota bacterium]
ERTPKYEYSGYTRQVSWVDQKHYQVRKVEFYDRRGDLLKTLTLENYTLYGGRFWRPLRMVMVNHQTSKQTVLEYRDYRFGQGLSDRDFRRNVLARLR